MKKILLVFLLVILAGHEIFAQCNTNISGSLTTCATGCNGSVTFTSTTGTPPYNLVVTGGPSVQYNSSYTWTNACAGSYHYDITDATMSCNDTGTVVVTAITPTVPPALTIEAFDYLGNSLGNNPTTCELQTIDFNVQVPFINILPNTFTWKKNSVPVLVQNNVSNVYAATYQSANLASGDVITLEVSCPNACMLPNPRVSQNIQFTVTPNQPPVVSISHNFPTDSICSGNVVTFTANAFEAGAPAYQWYMDGSPVGSASTYNTLSTLAPGSHNIWCEIVSNEICDLLDPVYNQWASSSHITLSVNPCYYYVPSSGSLGPHATCGSPFYDSGGDYSPVNYSSNVNGLVKFCPAVVGQYVSIAFTSLNLADAGDRLRIFSGTSSSTFTADTSSVPLFNIAGPASSSVSTFVTSTVGCLTAHFRTNSAGNAAGWVANVSCSASLAFIQGDVYLDANTNCIKDSGETSAAGIPLRLFRNNTIIATANTNSSGHYIFYATDSFYTVAPGPQLANYGVSPSCPVTGELNILSSPSSGNNLAMQAAPGYDFVANVISDIFRPGFNTSVYPYVRNFYYPPVSGQAKLIISNPNVSFVSAGLPPHSISGDTMIWNFSNLSNSIFYCGTLTFHTSTSASIGDTVFIKFMAEPDSGDAFPQNNIITNNHIVINSYDPNDKAVTPEGPVLPGSWLTYTVRFQNTGTATAYNISILDTLDFNLDLYTFQPLAASHPYDIVLLDSNVVKFVFNNIMLPDSNVNEPLSHGYITYRVKSLAGLPNGTPINNTAHIYFDFNPAVVTNTTVTIIDISTSVGEHHFALETLTLIPNPATNQVEIRNPKSEIRNIEVYNVLGEKIFSQQLIPSNQQHRITIDVSNLKPGIYFVKVKGEKEESVAKFVKQ